MPLSQRSASRGEAIVIVIAIVVLIQALPQRYHIVPGWFVYVGTAAMVLPMLLAALLPEKARLQRFERTAEFITVGVALALNCTNLLIAAYNLVENPNTLEPVPLFYTSVGIWTGNVLIFTLMYWLVDCDGPDARLRGDAKHPDFVFPAMDDPEHARPGWRPHIVDYLFLAFTTSTAFSPTEAMPFTPRAKLLVIAQSIISLVTIALVAARTINILEK
jgi:hypothetical protein